MRIHSASSSMSFRSTAADPTLGGVRLRGPIVLAATAAVFASAASATPQRDELIRPGVGIGKVRLAMTEAQVRRALGRPFATRSKREGFGRLRVELQFEDGFTFVTLTGRRGALRVIGVSTIKQTERTPSGVGVGTTERRLARIYKSLRCERLRVTNFRGQNFITGPRTCTLPGPRGTRTVFISHRRREWQGGRITQQNWPDAAAVLEIGVQAAG
jgi:hypothetical protein